MTAAAASLTVVETGPLTTVQDAGRFGQGALGIEIADDRDDLRRALQPLQHADTTDCTRAEREFARRLSGSCHTPLAAHACIIENGIRLMGFLGTPDGTQVLRGETTGARDDPEAVGTKLAEEFIARGAATILSAVASSASASPATSMPAPLAPASSTPLLRTATLSTPTLSKPIP